MKHHNQTEFSHQSPLKWCVPEAVCMCVCVFIFFLGSYQCPDTSVWQCAVWSASTSSVSADRLCTSPPQTPPSQHSGNRWTHTHRVIIMFHAVNPLFLVWFIFLSYPDFGDGMLHSFVVNLPEGDWIKLTLVQVGHSPVTCLLTQTLGRLQGVFKIIPAKQSDIKHPECAMQPPPLSYPAQQTVV